MLCQWIPAPDLQVFSSVGARMQLPAGRQTLKRLQDKGPELQLSRLEPHRPAVVSVTH